MLQAVAARLRQACPGRAYLVGGDEFTGCWTTKGRIYARLAAMRKARCSRFVQNFGKQL